MHRRAINRFEAAAGQSPQRDWGVRRAPGRGAQLRNLTAGSFAECGNRIDGFEFSLRRPHGGGGVALKQLDRVIAFAGGGDQVLGGDILGEVNEAMSDTSEQGGMLAQAERRDQWRDAMSSASRRGFAGGATVTDQLFNAAVAAQTA